MGQHAKFDPLDDQSGLHFVDVFRRSLLRTTGPQPTPTIWLKRRSHAVRVADKRRQQLIHCVMELKEAGIKFRRRNTDRFWDIKFENGVLQKTEITWAKAFRIVWLGPIGNKPAHARSLTYGRMCDWRVRRVKGKLGDKGGKWMHVFTFVAGRLRSED
ncbi:hypothetical protein Syun_011714 [Stephania yunnanensis]|uniref:Uncharacterized protein n=1 Tax=Stephania yunnanensis TaxID=152371 RepID=A0AAP0PGS1_9MAGN